MSVVLAFGGNALLPDPFHPEEQEERAKELAAAVRVLSERYGGVVLVHGNGPQVGMILLRVESTQDRIPAEPLDVLVSETQGSVGYLLSRALRNALGREAEATVPVTTILTQVVVDPRDPAFGDPQKPIGPHYDLVEAGLLQATGWSLVEVEPERWRRVVPSPEPLHVIELDTIARAARRGQVVVAGGGGGIPVCLEGEEYVGVEAVIDKDRTASLLARELDAEAFIVLTGVPHVSRAFGTPDEARIESLSCEEGRRMVAEELPRGSMGPKVDALCDYVEATGREGLITDTRSLEAALRGEAGTRISRSEGELVG